MPTDLIHQRPNEFRAALDFTSAETGFSARLIEKDYWCSLVLEALFASSNTALVFKGGTLLSKTYANFDRLSEDLDFTVSTSAEIKRAQRSRHADALEAQFNQVAQSLALSWKEPWSGHNNSTQHTGRLAYHSVLGVAESLLIEVSQREPTIQPVAEVNLKTLLLNPLFSEPVLPLIKARGLSRTEAYAEKVRAALTRKEPAIRDIYDLWQAQRSDVLPVTDLDWIALVKDKCAQHILKDACSMGRKEAFMRGITTDLHPVLTSDSAEQFDFEIAWQTIVEIHRKLLK